MLRRIIYIDEEKCNGCGLCVNACHEGAIGIVNGKAKLLRDDYCDGLGDCLPACPMGAITFVEREAAEYNETAVIAHREEINTLNVTENDSNMLCVSKLAQWPCQIKLMPVKAPYYDNSELLIAADCTAYAYANIHNDFMCGKNTLIGCPKLDAVNYSEKLSDIFRNNIIKSVSVLRMEVPCCGGLEIAVKRAIQNSGKHVPCHVTVISTDGKILDR